ncbi:phosphoribosylglycinamide formyltransferase [Paracidovorax oryzae]|uniref:phosphoribosylglycinamide formyltransferase n=1 Tax=Paracidovorax oryzae TaxID=862720 RepID=UPI0002F54923|nr:formyltransferase family protein [Paracidovorax oryzae]
MKNIVILISGGGSNMAAIVRTARMQDWAGRHGVRVAAVLSNKADAPGLAWAREQGIATDAVDHRAHASREAFDAALAQRIDAHDPALVVLAGFMRILTPGFVAHYAGRLVNIPCNSRRSSCRSVICPLIASSVSTPGMKAPPGMTVAGSPPAPLRTPARRPD